jgi:hypothetical protein
VGRKWLRALHHRRLDLDRVDALERGEVSSTAVDMPEPKPMIAAVRRIGPWPRAGAPAAPW